MKSIFTLLIAVAVVHATHADEISFNRDVRPILSDRCFKCHGPDAANQDSEFRVDTFDHATEDLGGYFGVVPGDLDASELHSRIHDEDDPMPPVDALKPLTDKERKILDQWILEGAKFESHWAFTPLPDKIDPPDSATLGELTDWSRGPVDRFIARGIVQHKLTPTAEASKNKWLRRVTFDLTGLPPTKQQISDYVADTSSDADAKVVDRLLTSDAYAERMTSEWLDVARYADSYGYQRDDERFVWPYRDWVIRAFKSGMPYDEFVTLQLAGDLLPNATVDQKLATTFNRLHSHKKEGGVAIEEFRIENVADRTHTVSTAMLGLTMECCRCHDHKYDPIPTEDYYSFSAFFDNVDENGLISYFTDAVPTPAMPLPNDEQQQKLDELQRKLAKAESARSQTFDRPAFAEWLKDRKKSQSISGQVAQLDFDKSTPVMKEPESEKKEAKDQEDEKPIVDQDKFGLVNHLGKDAWTPNANKLVEGHAGKAIELTGDDPVEIPGIGHFKRHDPFSFSFWIWSPESDKRAVIFRRSRGWDDAGSVGYELTREGDKLIAKLCHFWPGDAIAVRTINPLQTKRWTHVAVTYDGSSRAAGLKIFVEGHPAQATIVKDHLTRNISDWNDSYEENDHHDFAIGSRYRDRGFVGGKVDDFSAFDRQLSSIEVAQLFDNESLENLISKPASELADTEREQLQQYYELAVDETSQASRDSLRQARAAVNEHIDSVPAIMVMRETNPPRQTYVLDRGAYDSRGEPVAPQTPECLPPMADDLPRNRLGLARWLTTPNHPLTARVAVNRYWQLMFGHGLVRTPEDFGNQGEMPTHPELLDWLARDFVASGWNVRKLLRQIALSATYRQSSIVSKEQRDKDPTNLYFARGTGKRLSAEMIRDNILASSGLLIEKVGGAPVKPYDLALAYTPLEVDKGEKLYRRSLYTFWKRTSPAPVMMTLNTPTRDVCRMKREITDTPLQALVMLNGPQFIEAARVMAGELLDHCGAGMSNQTVDVDEIARSAFRRLTSREPTNQESAILAEIYEQQLKEFNERPQLAAKFLKTGQAVVDTKATSAELAAATVLINSIMNLDESVRHQ